MQAGIYREREREREKERASERERVQLENLARCKESVIKCKIGLALQQAPPKGEQTLVWCVVWHA